MYADTMPASIRASRRTIATTIGSGALLCALSAIAACATHEAEPAFRASVLIGDRGISIPLPPPSLRDEPEQEVEMVGEIVGLGDRTEGLSLRIYEQTSGEERTEALPDGELPDGPFIFTAYGIVLDLTDNCIELWIEDVDGNEGTHYLYQAEIDASGDEIVVVSGCE